MGTSIVASVNDVTSGYWNPAGLTGIKDNIQIGLMHNEQFAGIAKVDYGAIGFRLNDESAMAVSVIRMGVDDIPNTLNLMQNGQIDYSRISTFSSVDYGFIGSYARRTKIEGLTAGANVKVIRRVVGDFANAWGFGIDAGAQYAHSRWRFGAVMRDVTSTFNAWSYTFTPDQQQVLLQTGNALPTNTLELTLPRMILGVGHKIGKRFTVLSESNLEFTTDGQRNVPVSTKYFNMDARGGLEFGYDDMVFLRGSIHNVQRETEIGKTSPGWTAVPSVGAGIRIKNLSVDYALSNIASASVLQYSNIISVRLAINKKT
jgi:hypothetical protein